MRVGGYKSDVVDVNSAKDFPSLGFASLAPPVSSAPAAVFAIPESYASKRGKKKFSKPVQVQAAPAQAQTWGVGMFKNDNAAKEAERHRELQAEL